MPEAGARCRRCTRRLDDSRRICECGTPTNLASYKDRADFELREWHSYRERKRSGPSL